MNTRTLAGFLGAAAAVLLSCSSSSPTAGGGSDMPNGLAVVTGTVLLADSSPADSAEVVARELVLTPSGDSVVAEYSTITSSDGTYLLELVPGRYAVVVRSSDGRSAAVEQFAGLDSAGDTLAVPLTLRPVVDLVGFVALPPGFFYSKARVSIPGIGATASVGMDRSYLLEDVPEGYYDVAFTYDSIVNYLRVRVGADSVPDTFVQMRNLQFAVMGVMAAPSHEYHESTMRYAYAVTPIYYRPGQEPSWYLLMRLSRVTYYGWEGDMPVEWDPLRDPGPQPYDAVLSGVVYRELSGRVVLETSDGARLELAGPLVDPAGPEPVPVTVAVLVRSEGPRVWYEVVDIYPSPASATGP